MPDRYGDEPMSEFDTRAASLELKAAAIAGCELCDADGYRGARVCDHIDHRPAAKRGMAAVRAAMGWTQPTTHGTGERRSATS